MLFSASHEQSKAYFQSFYYIYIYLIIYAILHAETFSVFLYALHALEVELREGLLHQRLNLCRLQRLPMLPS